MEQTNHSTVVSKSVATPKPNNATAGKVNLLDKLRQQAGDKYTVIEVKEAVPLDLSKLSECVKEYIAILEKQGGKNSTITSFKMARIEIEDDIKFRFYVSTITSQKAIEQERLMLVEVLQKMFNNPAISFAVVVEEGEVENVPLQMALNSRERFELIASKYPMVRELKERLKLDLDRI